MGVLEGLVAGERRYLLDFAVVWGWDLFL